MKKTLAILVCMLTATGCFWKPWEKKAGVTMPEEEFATSMPAEEVADPPSTVLPTVPEAATAPARLDTSTPAYRVIRGSEVVDAGMIQVNDKFITLGEVLHPIRRRLQSAPAGLTDRDFRLKALELVRQSMKARIEEALMLAEADRKLTEVEKKVVEGEIDKAYRRALAEQRGSKTRLEDRLAAEGTSLAEWLRSLRRSLTVQTYLQRHVFVQMNVNRRMLWNYYRAHPEEFRTRGRLQMQIVAAPLSAYLPSNRPASPDEREQAKKLARRQIDLSIAALDAGGNFAEVAREYSKGAMASAGGVWPVMDVGSFKATFVEQAAYRQKVGETSGVLTSPLGFYIVRTLACTQGKELPFESVQGQIREKLRRYQYDSLARKYLDDLRQRATVVVAPEFEKVAVDAATSQFYKK